MYGNRFTVDSGNPRDQVWRRTRLLAASVEGSGHPTKDPSLSLQWSAGQAAIFYDVPRGAKTSVVVSFVKFVYQLGGEKGFR